MSTLQYPVLQSRLSELEEFRQAAKKANAFGFDIEATGSDTRRDRVVCLSMAVADRTWFVPFSPLPNAVPIVETRNWFNDNIFNDPSLSAIIHCAKYDSAILKKHGFNIMNLKLIDPMVGEWVRNEVGAAHISSKFGIFGLKELIKHYYGEDRPHWEEVKDSIFMNPAEFEKYSREDARDHWRLWFDKVEPGLREQGPRVCRIFYELEMPLIAMIMEMEETGIHFDLPSMENLMRSVANKANDYQSAVWKLANKQFNIASPDQLSDVLFHELKISTEGIPQNKKSKQDHAYYSTAKKAMKLLKKRHPIVGEVDGYRKTMKLKDGFIAPLIALAKGSDDGRVHSKIKQTGTRIGRLSSEDPNSQNMPRKGGVRDAVTAEAGKVLVVADQNQIEYRVLAHQSQDKALIEAYHSGSDMHKLTMQEVGCERTMAKNVNFGIIYGMIVESLAEFIDVPVSRAQEIFDKVFKRFPGILTYKEYIEKFVAKYGYVESIFGRRRRFYGLRQTHKLNRQAFHFTISGSAADIMKIGMVKVWRELQAKRAKQAIWREAKVIMQIHDELVMEVPEQIAEETRDLMKRNLEDVGGGRLLVPIKAEVGIGRTWTTAKC